MKLDDLKHLPLLTESAYYDEQDCERRIQEIVELKLELDDKEEGEKSENQVLYILGLIDSTSYLCEITGRITKGIDRRETCLVGCKLVVELSNGTRRPIQTRYRTRYSLQEFGLSEILEYTPLKKF